MFKPYICPFCGHRFKSRYVVSPWRCGDFSTKIVVGGFARANFNRHVEACRKNDITSKSDQDF